MITLLKTPFFATFLFVLMLPLLIGLIAAAPYLLQSYEALAALPAMATAAEWIGRVTRGSQDVHPEVLAALAVILPTLMLALFLAQRLSVWMVMPVGGGRGLSLPGDLATWIWGFISLRMVIGGLLGLLVAVPWMLQARQLGVSDGEIIALMTTPFGEITAASAFAPLFMIALAPVIGGMLALHGTTMSLRAAGITHNMPASAGQAMMQFLLAVIAAPLALLIVFAAIVQDPLRAQMLALYPDLRLGHVWGVALTAVIALQITYSTLHARAHLSTVMGRAVPEYLDKPSRSVLLDWADQQISDWRRERLTA